MHSFLRRAISAFFVVSISLAGFVCVALLHGQAQAPSTPSRRSAPARVQSAGNAGTITGVVADPTDAVVANATVTLSNSISGFSRSVDGQTTPGALHHPQHSVPGHTYKLTVTANTMAPTTQTVDVQSFVPIALKTTLQVASASTTVEVTASSGDLVETDPVNHTDIDRDLFSKIPIQGSSSVSALVTLASPGISADSNGMFHSMGDHASNSFSVDGQPITDQQSKVFSNQIPLDSVQSLEVIPGAPPAVYGGKTSLVIVATTRSGLANPKPRADVTDSYGTFGSSNEGYNLANGSAEFGNFISANVMNTGRFLDPPSSMQFTIRGTRRISSTAWTTWRRPPTRFALTSATRVHGSRLPTRTTPNMRPSGRRTPPELRLDRTVCP